MLTLILAAAFGPWTYGSLGTVVAAKPASPPAKAAPKAIVSTVAERAPTIDWDATEFKPLAKADPSLAPICTCGKPGCVCTKCDGCACGKCVCIDCGTTGKPLPKAHATKVATDAEPFRGASIPPIPLGAPVNELGWQREYWCGADKHGDRYDGLNLDDLNRFLAARNRDEAARWPNTIRSCNGQHSQPVAAPAAAPVATGRWVAVKVCRGGVCSIQQVWQP